MVNYDFMNHICISLGYSTDFTMEFLTPSPKIELMDRWHTYIYMIGGGNLELSD